MADKKPEEHGSISFTPKVAELGPEAKALMHILNDRLTGLIKPPDSNCIAPLTVAFPPCSDVLLALIKHIEGQNDEINDHFDDYFMFCHHRIIVDNTGLVEVLDVKLLNCTGEDLPQDDCNPTDSQPSLALSQDSEPCKPSHPAGPYKWPQNSCLPPSCVTLAGMRHLYKTPAVVSDYRIRRLFVADLVWLFFFERMGIFKIIDVILDDFATKGSIPISNGSVFPDLKDDVIALILEAMVRQTKTGMSSTVSDRASSYRRCLGWTSDVGRKIDLDSVINHAFSTHFHKFITSALEFYKDKRLAQSIQEVTTAVAKTSVSTLTNISETIKLLKKAFNSFDCGRNYYNTLNGIVWVIAAMAAIRELRTSIGIPEAYEQPHEYIPAAYEILVTKGPITSSQSNRYIVHRECANFARDILLDVNVINHKDTGVGGELEVWLDIIEKSVEGYRSAYRTLTGVDLGAPPAARIRPIEQEA